MSVLNTYTVSFFGHRDFSDHLRLESALENMLKNIINNHEFVEFLVGRNGEFDQFVSSVIRKVKRDFCNSNNELICVLPYKTAEFENSKESFLKYYDRIEIYTPVCFTHYKAIIKKRNCDIVSRSNLVIGYVNKKSGGAYSAVMFAQKNNMPFINLSENSI